MSHQKTEVFIKIFKNEQVFDITQPNMSKKETRKTLIENMGYLYNTLWSEMRTEIKVSDHDAEIIYFMALINLVFTEIRTNKDMYTQQSALMLLFTLVNILEKQYKKSEFCFKFL